MVWRWWEDSWHGKLCRWTASGPSRAAGSSSRASRPAETLRGGDGAATLAPLRGGRAVKVAGDQCRGFCLGGGRDGKLCWAATRGGKSSPRMSKWFTSWMSCVVGSQEEGRESLPLFAVINHLPVLQVPWSGAASQGLWFSPVQEPLISRDVLLTETAAVAGAAGLGGVEAAAGGEAG